MGRDFGWVVLTTCLACSWAAPTFAQLPEISATFEWIRLAQRVPVVIHLEEVPDEVKLRMGTTASVVVLTGTAGSERDGGTPALPRPLQ